MLIAPFIWGMLAALTALGLELLAVSLLPVSSLGAVGLSVVLIATVLEESVKLTLLWAYLREEGRAAWPMAKLSVSFIIFGLTFGLVELAVKLSEQGTLGSAPLLSAVLLHGLTALGMGVLLRRNPRLLPVALLAGISLHLLYNLAVGARSGF